MTRFIKNDDSTITDTQTGLIWTQQAVARDVNHDQAEEAVSSLGDGWRLPTVSELFTLVDHSRHGPAINVDAFPDTDSDWYWTNTQTAWNTAACWVVVFNDGFVDYLRRNYYACVRAVRAGQ